MKEKYNTYKNPFCWTEDNRLQAVKDDKMGAFYNYDASGERNLKLSGGTVDVTQNGFTMNVPVLDEQTLYASALVTINDKGYTKHYFEEGKRICSKIGSGGLLDINTLVDQMEMEYEEQFEKQKDGVIKTYEVCMNITPYIKNENLYENIIKKYEQPVNPDEPVFYYHSDHLGSASYITDDQGDPTQHLVSLPFGEDWVDMKYNTSQFDTPYKFNGKEKDEETGLHYYGARYLNTDLSIWLSVDPMSDKYPQLTSYNYCANNPVMLVDPDGRKITPASRSIWNGNKMSAAMLFSRTLKNYQTNGSNLKELAGATAALLTITIMESSSQTYNVNNSSLNRSQYNSETGAIDINVNCEGAFFNEIAHGGQFETNNLGYNKNGGGAAYDINDEREAFQLQYILVPQSIPDELKDKNGNIKITNDNIRNIKKDVNGTPTFPYNRKEVPDENLNGDSCNGEKRYCDPNGGLIFKDMHE